MFSSLLHSQRVLHKICLPYGKVLRIVIFHKNGLQALVEYPSIQVRCALCLYVSLFGAVYVCGFWVWRHPICSEEVPFDRASCDVSRQAVRSFQMV